MAWFDVGAGLAEMGKSMAQTASLALLEQQKSDNDMERLKLADELAGARESRGRKEAHGYDMEKLDKTQTFQADQGDKDRANRLQTTNISAGASIASAQIHAASVDKQLAAMQPIRTIEEGLKQVELAQKQVQADAQKGYQDAVASGDQAKIAEAQKRLEAANYSPDREDKQVAAQGLVVRGANEAWKTALNDATRLKNEAATAANNLAKLESMPLAAMSPEEKASLTQSKAAVAALAKQAEEAAQRAKKLEADYEAERNYHRGLVRQRLGTDGASTGPTQNGQTPLNKIITGPPRTDNRATTGEPY